MDRGKKINDRVNARFIRMVYEFMDEHRDVLSVLAKEGRGKHQETEQIASWLKKHSKKRK